MSPQRKRVSRELWDKARKANKKSFINKHLFKAILYELQPMDVIYTNHSFNILSIIKSFWKFTIDFNKACWNIGKSAKKIHYLFIVGFLVYWKLVKYLHDLLDAGPSILMLTALVLIFTFGLGDDSNKGLSAYSVFNKGFQSIMGGVDANALLNQHVGGGMAFMNVNHGRHEQEEEYNDGYRQRQQRQQQRDEQRRLQQERDHEAHLRLQQELDTTTAATVSNGARISNKKSRRKKNIELRRELRQQREAARDMGFVQDGQRVDINAQHQEQVAMNHLIQEQVGNGNGDFEEEREEL